MVRMLATMLFSNPTLSNPTWEELRNEKETVFHVQLAAICDPFSSVMEWSLQIRVLCGCRAEIRDYLCVGRGLVVCFPASICFLGPRRVLCVIVSAVCLHIVCPL